ncbi:MAG: hypothetical protein AAF527_06050, partial [Pseudomonadota bacterium]
ARRVFIVAIMRARLRRLLSDPYAPLAPRLKAAAPEFVSFDVFDTLATRIWLQPTDVFVATARRLRQAGLIEADPVAWAAARTEAEARLRRRLTGGEVRIEAIYDELARALDWPPGARAAACAIERDIETLSLRPVAETAAAWRALGGGAAALISDFYWDTESFETMLRVSGVSSEPAPLFLSSALQATKRTGDIFPMAAEALGRSPSPRWVHVGDNPQGDVRSAEAAGLTPLFYDAVRPNRFERALSAAEGAGGLVGSANAGAARAARLSADASTPHERVLARVSAGAAGPLMVAYCLWCLEAARAAGLSRLYFIARDGQILKAISERLAKACGWDIACVYLHGSRRSWCLPAAVDIGPFERDWLTIDFEQRTLAELLARADLTVDELAAPLKRAAFAAKAADKRLRASDERRLAVLLADDAFQAAMVEKAAAARTDALAYFEAQGLLDGAPIGVVDIGWNGRLQRALGRILRSVDASAPERLQGFYFGLTRTQPEAEAGRFATFRPAPTSMGGRSAPLDAGAGYRYPALIELFCAADHGGVRGFERTETGAYPALASETNTDALAWGLKLQQETMLSYTDNLTMAFELSDMRLETAAAPLRDAALAAFRAFAESPGRDEAEAYGRFAHAADHNHAGVQDLAGRVSPAELPAFLIHPGRFRPRTAWRPGTAARSAGLAAPAATAALQGRGALLRWLRGFRRSAAAASAGSD